MRSLRTFQYHGNNNGYHNGLHFRDLVSIWTLRWCIICFRCFNGIWNWCYPLLDSCLHRPDVQDRGSWTVARKLLLDHQSWVCSLHIFSNIFANPFIPDPLWLFQSVANYLRLLDHQTWLSSSVRCLQPPLHVYRSPVGPVWGTIGNGLSPCEMATDPCSFER